MLYNIYYVNLNITATAFSLKSFDFMNLRPKQFILARYLNLNKKEGKLRRGSPLLGNFLITQKL